ncbi:P-loop containing nucleoside triphosphate hydrolase protein [Pelagophyceae sp. CCMP2097]|nr:P-loop containing nucleoside triphosphate hydrolase protein [Pelagophyceae sp. CCMP2097]
MAQMEASACVRCSGVAYSYKLDLEREIVLAEPRKALGDLDLVLPSGCRAVLVGANGAGKSTLLRVLAGKHKLDGGAAHVLGLPYDSGGALNVRVVLVATDGWGSEMPNLNVGDLVEAGTKRTLESCDSEEAAAKERARLWALRRSLRLDEIARHGTRQLSDGERRRVQLFASLAPRGIELVLIDEACVELDLVIRAEFLDYLKGQTDLGVLYATHVFDGLDVWATDVVVVRGGAVVHQEAWPRADAADLYTKACEWIGIGGESVIDEAPAAPQGAAGGDAVIRVRGLNWGYDTTYRAPAIDNLSLELPRECRAVVVGSNGAGKTTALALIGGARLAPRSAPGSLQVLGADPMAANARALGADGVALLGGAFKNALAHDVARRASDVPFSELLAANLRAAVKAGADAGAVAERAASLARIFGVDSSWRLARCSSGQKTRIQLVLQLSTRSALYLVDELTRDLDVVAQRALLQWLARDTAVHGASVVYATHIYQGLDGWATHVVHVNRGAVSAIDSVSAESAPGDIYRRAKAWLEHDDSHPPSAPARPEDENAVQLAASKAPASLRAPPEEGCVDPFHRGDPLLI